jgi:taurine dioxygenase
VTTLTIEPAAGALGAFVSGIDLTSPLDPAQVEELRGAIIDHLVVFLPDQPMTLDHLETLTDALGGRDVTPFVRPLDDRPFVIRVIKEPDDELNFANAWHTDLSYLPVPPSFTLLHAWDVPDKGGDTIWANQYLAFETLSDGLRETLLALDAVHSAGATYGTGGYLESVQGRSSMAIEPSKEAYRQHTHPVVIRHPESGRPALFVNPIYTTRFAGWSKTESQGLLSHVYRHSVNENFTCRVRWTRHMLTIWDNRCTQHNALNDYRGMRREMFRTSVKGSTPTAYRDALAASPAR